MEKCASEHFIVNQTRTMGRYASIIIAAAILFTTGCGDYAVVDKTQFVVLKKDEYEKLKANAELGRSTGRYQIHRDGVRTWRLDTATGKICLLLTSQYDWDHDAKDQSNCGVEDALATSSR